MTKGKTFEVKASLGISKFNHLFPASHTDVLRYYSSNKKVAEVLESGKIKAVGKGTCKVYIVVANGARKAVTVTVK